MTYAFDFSFLESYRPDLLQGVWLTLTLSLLSTAFGLGAGILLAVGRVHGTGWVARFVSSYVELIRNTPLIIQTFWLFFGLAAMGLRIPAFWAASIALVVNVAAYVCEIVRAGLESVAKGQMEAADCLGLTRAQVVLSVQLPQALERVYPALVSQFVLMMLATSIMSQISVEELTGIGYRIQSDTFRGFEVYIVIAVIYVALSVALRLAMSSAALLAFPRRRRLGTGL